MNRDISSKNKIVAFFILLLLLLTSGFCMVTADADYVTIRDAEIKITDASRFDNPCDTVRLPESIAVIEAKGYTYIRISIKSIMKEKDDGYQSVMLYTGANDTAAFLYEFKFEHSPGKANGSSKTIVNIVSINISYFIKDEFAIRYGGSGKGADTFYVRSVQVDFEYTNIQGSDYITIDGVAYANKGAN